MANTDKIDDITKVRDFCKKKRDEFNPDRDSWNPGSVGYNQAMKDIIEYIKTL